MVLPNKPFIIDLIAPGSPVTLKQLKEAIQQVEDLGFQARSRVYFPTHKQIKVFSENSPKQKFQQLKQALLAPDSLAIWCVRGGYGSQKLLPFLMRMKKPPKPKLIIGYSDITALQVFLNLRWQWPALHFPVLTHVKDCSPSDLKQLKAWVTGVKKEHTFKKLKLLNQRAILTTPPMLKKQKMAGGHILSNQASSYSLNAPLTGGNLTVIQSTIGTAYAGSFRGKMLFLEDTNEAPYRIDRALWQMQQAGVFKGVQALLLGDFVGLKTAKKQMQSKLKSFADGVSFPVVSGVPLGHGPQKSALPFMTPATLHLFKSGSAWLTVKCFF